MGREKHPSRARLAADYGAAEAAPFQNNSSDAANLRDATLEYIQKPARERAHQIIQVTL